MSKTKTKKTIEKQKQTEESSVEEQKTSILSQSVHQFILLGILHILYIIFEAMNVFPNVANNWVSSLIYSIICVITIFCIWREWKSAKYLVPIPFLSLLIVGIILEFPEIVTAIFIVYCLFYFIMAFLKKDTVVSILTICISGLTFFILTSIMRVNLGFVKVNYEFNVVSCILLLLVIGSSLTVFFNKKNYGLLFAYTITFTLLCSLLPFVRPEGDNSTLFTLFCAISALVVGIVTFTKFMLTEEENILNIIPLVIIEQIGIIILSYSFTFNFDWLSTRNNILIIDYVIFMPLVLFVTFVFGIRYYPVHKDPENKRLLYNIDFTAIGIFLLFIISSMAMAGWLGGSNFNLIKALVISVLFFGMTIPLSLNYSSSVSLVSLYIFLGLVMNFVAGVNTNIVLITLMAFSSALILFAIINELYLMGEPLTSSMIISGSLLLMVCSFIFFELIEIWISVIWAVVGLYLFVVGVLFNKISLRRTGLIVILGDIIYSIVYLSIRAENKVLLGVGFMVLAVVLFLCIWLFRWSEQKIKKEKEALDSETNEIIETI